MPDVMKTLLLNPPSFENFDGGASSRWPATREIESYWYPVWLTYPAGMIPGSRLLDASPHKVNWQQTVQICKDYEFLILFTSTVGLESDIKLIRKIKESNPSMKIAFVGPHGHIKPNETLMASEDIDFVTRGEFDHSVVEYAHGKPLSEIQGVSYRKDGKIVHNPERPQLHTEELDALPFATDIYKRDLEIERYNVPFLLHPYVSFYTTRGCPAHAFDGKRGARSETGARPLSPDEGNFLRRRHFQYPQRPCDRSLQQVQAAEVPMVFHGARAQRLRNDQSDGRRRSAALHCGL